MALKSGLVFPRTTTVSYAGISVWNYFRYRFRLGAPGVILDCPFCNRTILINSSPWLHVCPQLAELGYYLDEKLFGRWFRIYQAADKDLEWYSTHNNFPLIEHEEGVCDCGTVERFQQQRRNLGIEDLYKEDDEER